VIVSSKYVASPVAVRLGWDEAARPNLVNSAGLPTRPFRTDGSAGAENLKAGQGTNEERR
jgi:hypothetical protein